MGNHQYQPINPPFTLNLREMPRKELKRFFQWYMDVIPERIEQLAAIVKETTGFESWKPDFTPPSLDQLGEWFVGQVEIRRRTPEEMQRKADKTVIPYIENWDLTFQTISKAMDVGMYFGQVMLKNHPSLKWTQDITNKRLVDYGWPIITGFGPVELNPVDMVIVMAYGVATRQASASRLREIYDYWSQRVQSAA